MLQNAIGNILEISAILLIYFMATDYYSRMQRTHGGKKYLYWQGVAQGLIGIMLITKKVEWLEYYTSLDTRAVALTVSGLLTGVIPTAIAAAIMSAFSIYYQSGAEQIVVQVSYTVFIAVATQLAKKFSTNWKTDHYYLTFTACTLASASVLYLSIALSSEPNTAQALQETILPVWIMMPLSIMGLGKLAQPRIVSGSLEDKLKYTENKFNKIVLCSSDCFWELNNIGNIVYVSESVKNILGYSPEELMGLMPHELIVHNESIKKLLQFRNAKEELQLECQMVFKHKKGYNIYCNVRGLKSFGENGVPDGYMGILHDETKQHLHDKLTRNNEKIIREQNTEFRNLYEELKAQNQQIKSANEKLTEATNMIKTSHENQVEFLASITNGLMSPIEEISHLADTLANPNTPQLQKNMSAQQLKSMCNYVTDLSRDLSDYDKIAKGRLKISLTVGNVDELISDIYDHFYYKNLYIDKKPILLKTTTDLTNDSHIIRTDFLRLRQILYNLVENSYAFTTSGKIYVNCKMMDHNELLFSVQDTGVGIPEGLFSYMFTPYYKGNIQLRISTPLEIITTKLSISKSIVEMLGGRMWFQSERGKGSTFYFTIPYMKPTEISEQDNTTYNWQNHQILLLGCNKFNNTLISDRIMKSGAKFSAKLLDASNETDKNTGFSIGNYFNDISLIIADNRIMQHPLTIKMLIRYPNAPVIITENEINTHELYSEIDKKLNTKK